MSTSQKAYLVRKEKNGNSKLSLLKLDQEQVIIGRCPSATYLFPTPMISRIHAILRKNEDHVWTVMDNKSINGVFVNLKKIVAMEPVCLKDGDEVRFGMNFDKESFNYVFCSSLTAAEGLSCRKRKHRSKDSPEAPGKFQKTEGVDLVDVSDVVKEKLELERRLKQMKDLLDEKVSRELALKEEMQRKEEEINNKKDLEQQLQQMENLLQERREAEEALHKEMEERSQQIKDDVQRQIEEERERVRQEVQVKYQRNLLSLEETLRTQLANQRDSLIAEQAQVETELQVQFEKANLEMQEKLKTEQDRLAKIIAAKELEQSLLEQRLQDAAASNEKNQAAALSARHEVLSNFGEMLEVELQCCVCSELLIQAVTLNCAHSFCRYCIIEWMKKNRTKAECPVCRAVIKCLSPSVVIDSFIDSIMQQLPAEKKAERKTIVNERSVQSANQSVPPTISAKFSQSGGTVGTRGQSASSAIEIATDTDDDSDEESNSDDFEDGVDGVYYGGFGRCFTCGERGHWSNGCPNR